MKHLLGFISIALFLCSCNSVKKATNRTQTNTDSVTNKTASRVDLQKTDSLSVSKSSVTSNKGSDSSYKKTTTVVKEYFGDEVDLGEDSKTKAEDYFDAAKDPAKKVKRPTKFINTSVPLYRETTTTYEEGLKRMVENAIEIHDNAGKISTIDSFKGDKVETSDVKKSTETKQQTKSKFVLLPPWLIIVLVLAVFVFLIMKYKLKIF